MSDNLFRWIVAAGTVATVVLTAWHIPGLIADTNSAAERRTSELRMELTGRMDRMEGRMEHRIDRMEDRMDGMEDRMDRMEDRISRDLNLMRDDIRAIREALESTR